MLILSTVHLTLLSNCLIQTCERRFISQMTIFSDEGEADLRDSLECDGIFTSTLHPYNFLYGNYWGQLLHYVHTFGARTDEQSR